MKAFMLILFLFLLSECHVLNPKNEVIHTNLKRYFSVKTRLRLLYGNQLTHVGQDIESRNIQQALVNLTTMFPSQVSVFMMPHWDPVMINLYDVAIDCSHLSSEVADTIVRHYPGSLLASITKSLTNNVDITFVQSPTKKIGTLELINQTHANSNSNINANTNININAIDKTNNNVEKVKNIDNSHRDIRNKNNHNKGKKSSISVSPILPSSTPDPDSLGESKTLASNFSNWMPAKLLRDDDTPTVKQQTDEWADPEPQYYKVQKDDEWWVL